MTGTEPTTGRHIVFICRHIVLGARPRRVVFTPEPINEDDSGFQFFCCGNGPDEYENGGLSSLNEMRSRFPEVTAVTDTRYDHAVQFVLNDGIWARFILTDGVWRAAGPDAASSP